MSTASPANPSRLVSLDALRGFDMLWIIGAETIVHHLARWKGSPWLQEWALQLTHVKWEGLRAYDLIFPLFMFLSGVSIPFSFGSRVARGDATGGLMLKIFTRTLLLVVLGLVYNGILAEPKGAPRCASVLGQIGIAWGIAATVCLFIHGAGKRACVAVGIIGTITILQLLVPVPGHGAGVLTQTGAINAWIDRGWLPGALYGKTFDPEGLLCIFSAASVTLAGAVAGSFLRGASSHTWRLAGGLFLAGAAVTAGGWVSWRLGYPPIKALWTGTFDLLVIGISLVVFSIFFAVIDVLRFQRLAFPLVVIGVNSLTIYLITRFFDFDPAAALLSGRVAAACGEGRGVVLASTALLLEWLLLLVFYRKRIFLRV